MSLNNYQSQAYNLTNLQLKYRHIALISATISQKFIFSSGIMISNPQRPSFTIYSYARMQYTGIEWYGKLLLADTYIAYFTDFRLSDHFRLSSRSKAVSLAGTGHTRSSLFAITYTLNGFDSGLFVTLLYRILETKQIGSAYAHKLCRP